MPQGKLTGSNYINLEVNNALVHKPGGCRLKSHSSKKKCLCSPQNYWLIIAIRSQGSPFLSKPMPWLSMPNHPLQILTSTPSPSPNRLTSTPEDICLYSSQQTTCLPRRRVDAASVKHRPFQKAHPTFPSLSWQILDASLRTADSLTRLTCTS